MTSEFGEQLHAGIEIGVADALLNVASTVSGASEALAYRAAAEDDDMLALLSDVLNDQVGVLRRLVR